jgi:hypothetical protein
VRTSGLYNGLTDLDRFDGPLIEGGFGAAPPPPSREPLPLLPSPAAAIATNGAPQYTPAPPASCGPTVPTGATAGSPPVTPRRLSVPATRGANGPDTIDRSFSDANVACATVGHQACMPSRLSRPSPPPGSATQQRRGKNPHQRARRCTSPARGSFPRSASAHSTPFIAGGARDVIVQPAARGPPRLTPTQPGTCASGRGAPSSCADVHGVAQTTGQQLDEGGSLTSRSIWPPAYSALQHLRHLRCLSAAQQSRVEKQVGRTVRQRCVLQLPAGRSARAAAHPKPSTA